MLIIPAIDIKNGSVVRLIRGRGRETVYSSDPLGAARHWQRQGAKFLHIVDLDAAINGSRRNLKIIKMIPKAVDIPVEIGGGLRSIASVKMMLSAGFSRVVLGTKAAEDQKFLERAFCKFGDKLIVSVDAKEDKLMTRGWRCSPGEKRVCDFISLLKKTGFREVIYTDTLKDGTLEGPNIRAVKNILKSGLKVIASGGVSSLEDIRRLKLLAKSGLSGIILGKSLYEGKFTLKEAEKTA